MHHMVKESQGSGGHGAKMTGKAWVGDNGEFMDMDIHPYGGYA